MPLAPRLLLLLLLALVPALTWADHVVLENGNVIEGEVTVDEAAGTVTVRRGEVTVSFGLDEVRTVVRDPTSSDDAPPADDPASDVEAVVIPMQGPFDLRRSRQEFDRVLGEALALKPRLILFQLDSPGGLVTLGQHFARTLLALDGHVGTVVYVQGPRRGAFSAAAFFALSCDAIFLAPGHAIGAAVPYLKGTQGAPKAVSAKFASKWKAEFRAVAEQKGHPPAVAAAMVGTEDGLAEVTVGETRKLVPARGLKPGGDEAYQVRIVCPPGQVLTLTGVEAVRCKLARAVVPNIARVLAGYRVSRAATKVLDDPLATARAAIDREQKRLDDDVKELAEFTVKLLERNPSKGDYAVDPKTGEFADNGRAWRRRTRECLKNVRRSRKTIEAILGRLDREPDLEVNMRWIKRLAKDLEQFEAELQRYRDIKRPPAR